MVLLWYIRWNDQARIVFEWTTQTWFWLQLCKRRVQPFKMWLKQSECSNRYCLWTVFFSRFFFICFSNFFSPFPSSSSCILAKIGVSASFESGAQLWCNFFFVILSSCMCKIGLVFFCFCWFRVNRTKIQREKEEYAGGVYICVFAFCRNELFVFLEICVFR